MVTPYHGKMPYGGQRPYGGEPHFGVWNKQDARFLIIYKGKTYKIARLVCEAFNGQPSKAAPVCMHLDENAANNRPDNLAWGTQKENLNAPAVTIYRRHRRNSHNPEQTAREELSLEQQ